MKKSLYQLPLIIIFMAFSFLQSARAQWEVLNPDFEIRDLTLVGKTFYGINNGKLVKSNNLGVDWYTDPDFSEIKLFVKHNDKFIISAIYKKVRGLYYSKDNMQTWDQCRPNVAFQKVILNDSAIFLLSMKDPYVYSPMSKSTDGGMTFQTVDIDTQGRPYYLPTDENYYCNKNEIALFIGGIGFFLSKDYGKTWKKIMNGLPMNDSNYSEFTSAKINKTGIGYTMILPQTSNIYYLQNEKWEVLNSAFYRYNTYNKNYEDAGQRLLLIRAYKDPFYAGFTLSEFYSETGELHLSTDKGKTWYSFTHLLQGHGSRDVLIYGDYLYTPYGYSVQTGPTTFVYKYGFGRLKLSAASEIINTEVKKQKLAAAKRFNSPFGRSSALGLLGAKHFAELNELLMSDSEELLNEAIEEFIEDYGYAPELSNYFSGGQPGMCSFMGMPSWSVNLYDLKLYVRDIIFRKKGLGPETKLALNYINTDSSTPGMFGHNWKFEYEMSLQKMDSSFILKTGQGAIFNFKDSKLIQLTTTPFALPCVENSNLKLHWDGQQLILNKLNGREIVKFISAGENAYLPVSVEDSYGLKSDFQYDAQNRLIKIKDASDRIYRFSYNNLYCDSIIAPDKRFAMFSYDNTGLLSSSVDFEGVETKYSYDSLQNITVADIGGKLTQFNYSFDIDSMGCINSIVDPEQRQTMYYVALPDSLNSTTTVVMPGQQSCIYNYYKGELQTVTNNADDQKKIYYNANQQIDSLVWYDGSKIEFAYDSARNVVYTKNRKGEQINFEYDANNNLISKTDDKGKVLLQNTYNNKNQLISSETTGNQKITYNYDTQGAVQSVQTSGGKNYSWTRDNYGNINSFTNPLGKTIHFSYNETGMQPVEKTDFSGNKYKLTYNNNGRLAKVSMPDGSFRDFYYDCCTQTGMTDEKGQLTSVIRDATNRILEKNYPDGRKITYLYDENGYIKGFKNLYGATVRMTYNDYGKLTSVTDDEGTVRYGYNKNGLCNQVTDKRGNTISYVYDDQMRLISKNNPMWYEKRYSYNENNQLSSINDVIVNKTRSFKYNERGNVIEKSYESVPYASYTYDADNDLTSFSDSTGTTTYVRDNGGFVSSIVYPGNKTLTFQYDDNGNLIKTTYPNGFEVINQLNNLNRITGVSWKNASVSYTFDAAGNTLTEVRSNQVNSTFEYNENNILLITDHATVDSVFFSEEVLCDSGIIKSIQMKSPVEVVKAPAIITNAEYDSQNQLSFSGTNNRYYYDTEGYMTYIFKNSVNTMRGMYTPDNMLSYLKNDNNTVQITYDAMRYPRKMTRNGVTIWLYYDHKGRMLFETDASGNISRNYIYRGKRLIAFYEVAADKTYFYHYNRNGNTIAITDQDGVIQNAYVYSISGQILGSKENVPNRNTFLGAFGALQLDNDFVLTGSRVYCPVFGRYIQSDPLGLLTGTNPYLYADNNPAAGIDPYGLANDQSTVNTLDFDPPSDNNYGTAAGTANPYAEGLKYRDNNWDTYGSASVETLKDFKNSPATDFLPGKYMDPMTHSTAIVKVSEGEFLEAAWQYVPFNNSLEAAGNAIQEHMKTVEPPSAGGLGVIVTFGENKFTQCDL